MRGERAIDGRKGGVLDTRDDRSPSGSALAGLGIWFFAASPGRSLPGGVKASGPPRRITSVHVIVLGIDPGTANTGYGVVAHHRGRLVALDGGVIETAPGQDPGAAPGARSTSAWAR